MSLLTDKEAAEYLGVTERQLSEWRRARCAHPIPFKALSPRCIRYLKDDLDAWVESRTVNKITLVKKAAGVKHG